jgi:hypothetical protein
MVALFFTVWGGFSAGWAKASAEAYKEKAAKAKGIAELSKARKEEIGALRDEELAKGAIKQERTYLKKLEGITEQQIELEEGSLRKLMKLKTWLGQLAAAGVRGTEEARQAKQRIINIIRAMTPTAKREEEATQKLENLTDAVRMLEIAEFKDLTQVKNLETGAAGATEDAARDAIKAHVERKTGLLSTPMVAAGAAAGTPVPHPDMDVAKQEKVATQILAALKKKWAFEKKLKEFEEKLKTQSEEYVASLHALLASLNTEDFTASSAALQQAINLKQEQDRELKTMTTEFTGLEAANNVILTATIGSERALLRAVRKTTT